MRQPASTEIGTSPGAFFVVLALAAMLMGCSKPAPRQLTGQVFIVTRAKESIKMGLVEVRLYDLRVVEDWLREFAPRVAANQKRAEELLADAKSTEVATYSYFKALIDAWELGDETHAAGVRADKAIDLAKAANAYLQVMRSGAPYFWELPKVFVASTKTDADGHFAFEVPAKMQGDCALIASASRAVPAGEELYFWAIRAPTGSSKVALTNDNLTSMDDRGSLVHTIELDPEFTKALNENMDDLQSRVAELMANPPAAKHTPKPMPVAAPPPHPLPDFSPLPPTEFVRLTQDFILVDAKGRELRNLPAGKRLRVVSRDSNGVTISSYGEPFLIPSNITEPSE